MRFNCIKQHDSTDCGAACLSTIAKQYGLSVSVARVRELAGTDRVGTSVLGMVRAAEQLGFKAKSVKGDVDAFYSGFKLPAIAAVVRDGFLHYVVIHRVKEKEITIADPTIGVVKKKPTEFFGEWIGVLIIITPIQSFKKKKRNFSNKFLHLILTQKRLVIEIFVLSTFITFFGIVGAFYLQIIIDEIIPAGRIETLTFVSLGVLVLNLLSVLLGYFRNKLTIHLSQNLDISLLLGYYNYVTKLPMNFFGTRKVGEVISRFQDGTSVREAISEAAITVLIDTLMAIACGIILFFKSKVLFIIVVFMLILYAILVFAFNKPLEDANEHQMEDNAQLTSYLVESINGIQTVKIFNRERTIQSETEFRFFRFLKSFLKLSNIINIQEGLKEFVEMAGGTIVIWVGASNVLNGNMTVGSLLSFNALLLYFLNPVRNLINLQPKIQTAIVATQRLNEVLELEIEKNEAEEHKSSPKSLKGDIELKNVSFRYGMRHLVLNGVNIKINKGERIAIIGESGSGKTTIAKLLLNLYQYESGEITIDGYTLTDIKTETLRDKIAYVPQDTFLFSSTIMDNIVFGLDNPNIDDVMYCTKITKVNDFVELLPLRYETRLDENGSNLSGGQKQRIAIARAILKKPDILILDEATSNLDTVTEMAIQETIDSLSNNMTTIIIAHRLSTLKYCDKIFVMDKGVIVEEGTHDYLLKKEGGYYRKLCMSQSNLS